MQTECKDCALFARRTQVVMPTPCRKGGLLAVGEAPGADEDIAGEGFVGRAGRTLDSLLRENGVQRSDYGRANICWCRPVGDDGKNRKPAPREVDACLPKLAEAIGQIEPSVILCVGWTPGKMFFGQSSLFDAIRDGGHRVFHPNEFGLPSVLRYIKRKTHVVVMPHTSPLAFNRNAPDGRKWADIARKQIALAVTISRGQ